MQAFGEQLGLTPTQIAALGDLTETPGELADLETGDFPETVFGPDSQSCLGRNSTQRCGRLMVYTFSGVIH